MGAKRASEQEPRTNVLVTVDEQHRDQLKAVARRLETAGLNVADIFPLGGVIAGEVATTDLGKLQRVEGIASVEEEPRFSTA